MPSGVHWPSAPQTLREGPSSSKPGSQKYVATVATASESLEKMISECAGAPGYLQLLTPATQRRTLGYSRLSLVRLRTTEIWLWKQSWHNLGEKEHFKESSNCVTEKVIALFLSIEIQETIHT